MTTETKLTESYTQFLRVLEAATIRIETGWKVDGIPHSVAIRKAAARFSQEVGLRFQKWIDEHGKPTRRPSWITLEESDSPDGPWQPVPDDEIEVSTVPIAPAAELHAALDSAMRFLANKTWNVGDIITTEELSRLKNVGRWLSLPDVRPRSKRYTPPPCPQCGSKQTTKKRHEKKGRNYRLNTCPDCGKQTTIKLPD